MADPASAGQAEQAEPSAPSVLVMKPQTFMNHSGRAVAPFARYRGIRPEEILVIHDELDFPPGKIRYKFGGSEAGNNGLKSISDTLATKDYWRLRLGIGRPAQAKQVTHYVLKSPPPAELAIYQAALDPVLDSLPQFIWGSKQLAIHQVSNLPKP